MEKKKKKKKRKRKRKRPPYAFVGAVRCGIALRCGACIRPTRPPSSFYATASLSVVFVAAGPQDPKTTTGIPTYPTIPTVHLSIHRSTQHAAPYRILISTWKEKNTQGPQAGAASHALNTTPFPLTVPSPHPSSPSSSPSSSTVLRSGLWMRTHHRK